MNTLYAVTSIDQKVHVQLSFGNSGYCVEVQDINSKHSVSTSYGFGYEGYRLARGWFEKVSGETLRSVRKGMNNRKGLQGNTGGGL